MHTVDMSEMGRWKNKGQGRGNRGYIAKWMSGRGRKERNKGAEGRDEERRHTGLRRRSRTRREVERAR